MNRCKGFRLLLLIFSLILFTGCSAKNMMLDIDQTMPQVPDLPLHAYWTFQDAKSLDRANPKIDKGYYEGLGLYITAQRMKIGRDEVPMPRLKAMNIKTYDYFLTKYRMSPQEVGIPETQIPMITVTDAKGFAARIFQLEEDRIALERNGILVFFTKVASLEDTGLQTGIPTQEDDMANDKANGVLIGLRGARTVTPDGIGEASYRTIWLCQKKGGPLEVYIVPNILFPKDVFYEFRVERGENREAAQETIVIENLSSGQESREGAAEPGVSRYNNLTFISNDYLSLESRLYKGKEEGAFQYYSTRNVDRLNYEDRVSITDLFGPEGQSVMKTAYEQGLSTKEDALRQDLDDYQANSFILKRGRGRWAYEGRVNNQRPHSDNFLTYPMIFRDNEKVYRYDDLEPSWSDIKRRVPEAKDAISSPGDYFVVVQTENQLLVYPKLKGQLGDEPLANFSTPGETIVMHEWARGDYVNKWTAEVTKRGIQMR